MACDVLFIIQEIKHVLNPLGICYLEITFYETYQRMSWRWLWRDGWSREWEECTDLAALQILLLNTAANLFEVRYWLIAIFLGYFANNSSAKFCQINARAMLFLLSGSSPCPLTCITDPLAIHCSFSRSSPNYQLENKSANLLIYNLRMLSACISSWPVR